MELDLENLSVGHLIETEKGQHFLLNLILFYGVKSRKSRKSVLLEKKTILCSVFLALFQMTTLACRRPPIVDLMW